MPPSPIQHKGPLKLLYAQAVSPSDSTEIQLGPEKYSPNVIYVGTAGHVTLKIGGVDIQYKNIAVGIEQPKANFTHVMAASTAGDIVVGFAP